MTKAKLILKLNKIRKELSHDTEVAHARADEALLEYIDDEQIKRAYERIDKWYA